jgi:hypothetical protein
MAGAQVPITDAFGEFGDETDQLEAVREVVTETFFDVLHDSPGRGGTVDPEQDSVAFGFDRVLDVNDD